MPRFFFLILIYTFSPNGLASWVLTVSESNGLPILSTGGKALLKSNYVFWDRNWDWAGFETHFKIEGPMQYTLSGVNKRFGLKLQSPIREISDRQVRYTFEFDASRTTYGAIGGGISFEFDLSHQQPGLDEPKLLPGERGWSWDISDNTGLRIEFEPKLESLYFERGNKSEIRAFIYRDIIPKGQRRHRMTVTLYGDIQFGPTIGERFGTLDLTTWIKKSTNWQTFPIDLSFLNATEKPAGKHGFLKADGERLVFENGKRIRFWGTNITANSLFGTSKTNISRQAKRLSRMGFNLVRLHHHDSDWVNPNIFGQSPLLNTQSLSDSSFDKIDWWIKSLKDEGIYIWLDLHVGRQLMEGDNIYAFDEISRKNGRGIQSADLRGYNYVNPSIKNAMKRFNRQYLTHVNPYTKLAYKDEPAIVAMLITNENDATHHFGNRLLPNRKVPRHNRLYMREAKRFAKKHELSDNKIWQSWLHGDSKLFLNDLEHRFNKEIIDDLRKIGVRVPIVTTSAWGNYPLASLPALTDGDIIDAHTYGTVLELEKDPFFTPSITTWLAASQVAGKPMSVSEWNVSPFPTPDRYLAPLLIASKANHQGWDALMQYAYAKDSLNNIGKPSNWVSHNDPAFLTTFPAAALLFRRGDVKEANTIFYMALGESIFHEEISPKTSVSIRTAVEQGKLVIAMPKTNSLHWLTPTIPPENARIIKDHTQSLIQAGTESVTSDTGELFRDWKNGIYTINTTHSQAAVGWIGGTTIKLADSKFNINVRNAGIVVQSLDENPVSRSGSLLISLASPSVLSRDFQGNEILPFLSQPLSGRFSVRSRAGLTLYRVNGDGERTSAGVNYENGWYQIDLDEFPFAQWLLLTADF